MKWLFNFILSHSIFIAFCAAALSLQTLQLLALPINGYRLFFIFFATLYGYNAYWMVSRYNYSRPVSVPVFMQKNKTSFWVMLLALVGLLYCVTKVHLVMYNIFFALFLLGLYAIPVMPFRQPLLLKKAGILKTVILAFAWTIVTTLVPLQISFLKMGQPASLVFVNRFLFMLLLCIIFDKRDAAVDKIRGLQSLATVIKPMVLHYLFGLIFIAYIGFTFALGANQVTIQQVIALMLAGIIALPVYILSLQKRGYLFYYFLVDGLMFFSAVLTGIAGIL
jgi:hypothetical protein